MQSHSDPKLTALTFLSNIPLKKLDRPVVISSKKSTSSNRKSTSTMSPPPLQCMVLEDTRSLEKIKDQEIHTLILSHNDDDHTEGVKSAVAFLSNIQFESRPKNNITEPTLTVSPKLKQHSFRSIRPPQRFSFDDLRELKIKKSSSEGSTLSRKRSLTMYPSFITSAQDVGEHIKNLAFQKPPSNLVTSRKRFIKIKSIKQATEIDNQIHVHVLLSGAPIISHTYIKYRNEDKLPKEKKPNTHIVPGEKSFQKFFEDDYVTEDDYHPYLLDDPNLGCGKRRKVLNLPGLISSTLPFVRTSELKEELNEQFTQKHPHLNSSLTLSKIRKLKLLMLACSPLIEVGTIATAVVYMEKLILKNYVNKDNRKIVACVCLLLATKMNETHNMNFGELFEEMEEHFGVPKKKVLEWEFPVFSWLEFCLVVPMHQSYPHFKRLLMMNGLTPQEYLSDVNYPN